MDPMAYRLCSSSEEGEIKPNQLKGDRYYHIENFPAENSYLKYLYHRGAYVGPDPVFTKENIIYPSEMSKGDINYVKNRVQKSECVSKLYKYYTSLCLTAAFGKNYEVVCDINKVPFTLVHLGGKRRDVSFCGEINDVSPNIKKKFGLFSLFHNCYSENEIGLMEDKSRGSGNPENNEPGGFKSGEKQEDVLSKNNVDLISEEEILEDKNSCPITKKKPFSVIIADFIYEKLTSDDLIICEVKKNENRIFIGEHAPCRFSISDIMNRYIERVVTMENDYTEYNLFGDSEFQLIEISYTVFGEKRIYHSLLASKNSTLLLKSKSIGLVDINSEKIHNKEILYGLLVKLRELDGVFVFKDMKLYRISENGAPFLYKGFDVLEFVPKRNF